MNPIIWRFLKKIQPYFSGKDERPTAPAPATLNERSFNRFAIETEVLVTTVDAAGNPYAEKSALRDISGSGAMFITGSPEIYFIGQSLKLDIFLAGTDAVRACVKTEAEVVRMQPMEADTDRSPFPKDAKMGVAVKFSLPFEFQRMDDRSPR